MSCLRLRSGNGWLRSGNDEPVCWPGDLKFLSSACCSNIHVAAMLLCNVEEEFVTTKETALYPHVRSDPFGILRTTFFIDYRNIRAERG